MDRQKMRFTREQRMAIVREYETSSLMSCPEKSRHTTKKCMRKLRHLRHLRQLRMTFPKISRQFLAVFF